MEQRHSRPAATSLERGGSSFSGRAAAGLGAIRSGYVDSQEPNHPARWHRISGTALFRQTTGRVETAKSRCPVVLNTYRPRRPELHPSHRPTDDAAYPYRLYHRPGRALSPSGAYAGAQRPSTGRFRCCTGKFSGIGQTQWASSGNGPVCP
ncbi:hypothetical protein RP29_00340 [Acidovorax temperans]|uniref:Uncharacterized protein n=1 Tax=Acidovorax temperans TaxID=80878 RepID=A0A0D7KEM2_9BURK|nr:hypothetical protein RP29_00340 [Acidovorax temperans]